MKIVFICTGNTCRSPMAEGIMKDKLSKIGIKNIEISSAGIMTEDKLNASQNSIIAMAEKNINIDNHKTRILVEKILFENDIIITMTNAHKEVILRKYPNLESKVFTLSNYADSREEDIKDPYGRNIDYYKNVLNQIEFFVDKIVKNILENYGRLIMKIVLASDHGGYNLKEDIKKHLVEKGYEVVDFGTHSLDSVNYPDYGKKVGLAIANGEFEKGILVCGTGIGISLAANKIKGIRAAVVSDVFSAKMSRAHNNANILSLGERVVGKGLAFEIVDAWLNTEFEGGRHQERVDLISEIEKEYL